MEIIKGLITGILIIIFPVYLAPIIVKWFETVKKK